MGSFLFLNVGSQFSLLIKYFLSNFSGFFHFLSKFVSQLLSFFNVCISCSNSLCSKSSQLLSFDFSLMLDSSCLLSPKSFFFFFLFLSELSFSFFLSNRLIVDSFKLKLSCLLNCNLSFFQFLSQFLLFLPLCLHFFILLFSDFLFLLSSLHSQFSLPSHSFFQLFGQGFLSSGRLSCSSIGLVLFKKFLTFESHLLFFGSNFRLTSSSDCLQFHLGKFILLSHFFFHLLLLDFCSISLCFGSFELSFSFQSSSLSSSFLGI